jgi:hypothetical protein
VEWHSCQSALPTHRQCDRQAARPLQEAGQFKPGLGCDLLLVTQPLALMGKADLHRPSDWLQHGMWHDKHIVAPAQGLGQQRGPIGEDIGRRLEPPPIQLRF